MRFRGRAHSTQESDTAELASRYVPTTSAHARRSGYLVGTTSSTSICGSQWGGHVTTASKQQLCGTSSGNSKRGAPGNPSGGRVSTAGQKWHVEPQTRHHPQRKRHIGRHPRPITEPRQASAAHLDTRQAFAAYKGTQAGICGTPGQPNRGHVSTATQ